MNQSDKAEFAKVVLAFAELKGKSLSLPAVDLYWAAMQSWEIADFKAAATHLLKTCEFMPVPKDFEDLIKAGRSTAGEAFATALGWARSGAYRTPARSNNGKFIDRVIHALGGWQVIARCEDDKLHFLERRFTEHFETMQDSEDVRASVPQIADRPDWLRLQAAVQAKQLA